MESDFALNAARLQIASRWHVQPNLRTSHAHFTILIHAPLSLCCASFLEYGIRYLQLTFYKGCGDVDEKTVGLSDASFIIPRSSPLTRLQLPRVFGR